MGIPQNLRYARPLFWPVFAKWGQTAGKESDAQNASRQELHRISAQNPLTALLGGAVETDARK